ncbi:MAG: hypothetical protein HY761_01215 [Candidatus Omnitrophica bacterium]|nr:hypothetical protein [Candidatus Omnitrophota bacterium]
MGRKVAVVADDRVVDMPEASLENWLDRSMAPPAAKPACSISSRKLKSKAISLESLLVIR